MRVYITAMFFFIVIFLSPIAVNTHVSAQQRIAKENSSILIEKGIDFIYNQGNYTHAIKDFDKVLALYPNNVYAIFYKGVALNSLGNQTQAQALITKAIRILDQILIAYPKNVDILALKGRALNRMHNYTGAITYFDKALDLDPNHKYSLVNKGLSLSRLGKYTGAYNIFR